MLHTLTVDIQSHLWRCPRRGPDKNFFHRRDLSHTSSHPAVINTLGCIESGASLSIERPLRGASELQEKNNVTAHHYRCIQRAAQSCSRGERQAGKGGSGTLEAEGGRFEERSCVAGATTLGLPRAYRRADRRSDQEPSTNVPRRGRNDHRPGR